MSVSTTPTAKMFEDAIKFLYAFGPLRDKHIVDIREDHFDLYGKIGEFLSDPGRVSVALAKLDAMMTEELKRAPEEYSHAEDSDYVKRIKATRAGASPALEAKPFEPNKQWKGPVLERKQQAHEAREAEKKDLREAQVRYFKFHKLLRYCEGKLLGVADRGVILTKNIGINSYLQGCEVWKDSIGIEHGEYTHRLQWLAVAIESKLPPATLQVMYKGCSAMIKGTIRTYLGLNEKYEPASNARGIPISLWTFLFDCFPVNAQAPDSWPGKIGDTAKHMVESYRFADHADNCRSPDYCTKMILNNPGLGLLFAYVSSSKLKLLRNDLNKPQQGLSAYRNDRAEQKHSTRDQTDSSIIFRFPTPLQPSSLQ